MTRGSVHIDHVSKKFRLYKERNQSLKSAVLRRRISVHEDFWAVKDVTFDVAPGTTLGLIGSNGSGKSTLLKCMARIFTPDAGTITADGRVAALLEVGSGFHPELSGRENVYLNASILGMSKKAVRSRFDEIVEFAGVGAFIDQPVKNYSSGMYVRLGFAVAINVEPDILVVDEVLAVGDIEFQHKCAEKFRELRRDGRTVILVSHAMEAVRSMCDEVVWMSDGAVVEQGPTDVVVDNYLASLSDV